MCLSNKFSEGKFKALFAAHTALMKQAEDVLVMDLRPVSSASDFFVLATAASHRQIQAIVDQIEREMKRVGQRVWYVEGLQPGARWREQPAHVLSWVLMDCGDVVVHVFNAPGREFYRLERLWADAPRVPLGELFATPQGSALGGRGGTERRSVEFPS